MSIPRTGIVAIGRNEGERLRRCLASIDVTQTPVAYVDSASTDGSVELAKSFGAIVVTLDMTLPFTAARARNVGMDSLLAHHPLLEYVQFVDGDCEFEPSWIAQAVRFLDENSDVAVVCGRRRERFPEASLYNRICDAEWDTPIGEASACGGDALMRRNVFGTVGGYDPVLAAGEEPELCHRIRIAGWRVWRLDAPMTIHDAAMHHFRQWWLRAVRSGMGYMQAWTLTSSSHTPLYRRETVRAVAWTIGVAAMTMALMFLLDWQLVLVAPLLWSMQFLRLAARNGLREGGLLFIGKFPEMIGITRFLLRRIMGRAGGTIFYK